MQQVDGGVSDEGNDNELLSLVENSVQRIPVSRDEFETKLGGRVFRRAATTDDDESTAVYRFPGGNKALCKLICLETATSSSSNKKKTLYAAVQKWIEKCSRKQKLGVKVLSAGSTRHHKSEGGDECLLNPRMLLDQYVRKMAGMHGEHDDYDHCTGEGGNNTQGDETFLGCGLLTERSQTNNQSLAFYHSDRGILFEGEIRCNNQRKHESVSNASSHLDSNPPPQIAAAVLKCAASLYYELWYFRTIQAKDVSRAYGFSITAISGGDTDGDAAAPASIKATIWVTLLMLEKPQAGPIGGRYTLYEYTKRSDLVSENGNDNGNGSDTQSDGALLDDLGHLLVSSTLPCPFLDATSLNSTTLRTSSPGYMLLPMAHQRQLSSLYPLEASSEFSWQVIPTITGSLVIRCKGVRSVVHILQLGCSSSIDIKEEKDVTQLATEFQNAAMEMVNDGSRSWGSTDDDDDDDDWYVKYKTPPFGPFWDTARIAINGTRSLLLRRQSSSASIRRTTEDHAAADAFRRRVKQEWLRMYPIDSFVDKSRSITIMKSMGVSFVGRNQLSWKDFQLEFASLMKGTLYFQSFCNTLIHGDINEGNVLYDTKAREGSRLKMIDWDEALRGRPCHRQVSTEEERLRYPMELVTFPEQYTKQQLLHLFQTLVGKHYLGDHATAAHVDALFDGMNNDNKSYGFLSRASVDVRFKSLLHFLLSPSPGD